MPFKSLSQRRKFYAMAERGEISPKVVKEWEDATPKDKKLPEKVASPKSHAIAAGVGALGGAIPMAYLGVRHGVNMRTQGQKDVESYYRAEPEIRPYMHYSPIEKEAFAQGFEKQAFWGSIVGAAAKAGKILSGFGKNVAYKGMGAATNPAASAFKQGLGRAGMSVGTGIRQTGNWIARNPGMAAMGAGAGVAGMGAGMAMGGNKQASAFEQGFAKQAGIVGKTIKAIEERGVHPAELAGLGVLAVPAVQHLATGKAMSEKAKDAYDVAGLGILAAPSAAHYAGKLFKH